jgi:hypothetical protein
MPDHGFGHGSFTAFGQSVPDELLQGGATGQFLWPYMSAQIYNEDTIMHMLAREYDQYADFGELRYFRRVGPVDPEVGDPPGSDIAWTGFTVDTINAISHVVECATEGVASGFEGKTALVWSAHWPAMPGGSESETAGLTGNVSYLVDQCRNDIYCMISLDGGNSWENLGGNPDPLKHNCSRVDSSVGGYVPLGDVGALIDSEGRLHIVWAARPTGGLEPGKTGATALDWEWPRFPFASRILHWTDDYLNDPDETDYISIIKDMTLDWTSHDSICFGGAWHEMSLNQPQMTQCHDKLYCIWAQYQDLENGSWDDCDIRNFTQLDWYGTANSQLYFSASTLASGGLNWDQGHHLTAYVGRCDTVGGSLATGPFCHSHFWPSVARTGMLIDDVNDDFGAAEIVQDGGWTYNSVGWYFDVTYVDDRHPGAAVQGEGGWTRSPIRWVRVPCIEPDPVPRLAIDPLGVFEPSWGKPGVEHNIEVKMINIGNSALTINDISTTETEGPISGWLDIDKTSSSISEQVPNNVDILTVSINNSGVITGELAPAYLEGYVTFSWDGGNQTIFPISYIVADTVQPVESDTIFTPSISLAVNNCGGAGLGLRDTLGQMDFHPSIDCDNCYAGTNNKSESYLYDASPFILHETATDTMIYSYIYDHSWLSHHPISKKKDGFRPTGGIIDLGYNTAFSAVSTNIFYSADSTFGLECRYLAPKEGGVGGAPEKIGNFIGQEIKVFNISGAPLTGIYVGDIIDIEIPSDSAANPDWGPSNYSDYNADLNVMYAYGWETAIADTFCDGIASGYPNDCAISEKRYGGSTYIGGYKYEDGYGLTYNRDPGGMFTDKVSRHFPRDQGHLNYDSLFHYQPLDAGWSGYETYYSPDPDSAAMDLFITTLYGQFDLGVADTLYFYKAYVAEYQDEANGDDFIASVEAAREYMMEKGGHCCRVWGVLGDADVNGVFDILDLIWMIDNKFKGGDGVLWPDPANGHECTAIMDFNGDGIFDMLDLVWGIDFKFKPWGIEPRCPL